MRPFRIAAAIALTVSLQAASAHCFTLLSSAPGRKELPAEETQSIQKAHLAHLGALAAKRWLLAAGPILTPGNLRGILISACQSAEEANRMESADPAVAAGLLAVETLLWDGPDGIGDRYWREKTANPNAPDRMLKFALVFLLRTPAWEAGPKQDLLTAHQAHLIRLRQSGKLAASGPATAAGGRFAILVFKGVDRDEARRLAEQDPLVIRGLARPEAFDWLAADGTFPE